MGKITNHILGYLRTQTTMTVAMTCSVVILAALFIGAIWYLNKGNSISIEADRRIDITPAQIQSIKDIGHWEFLSIADEELVDTIDRGFFRDKELVRIYYGTLRLGIDMGKINEKWITVTDSVVNVTLPPIELLDRNFIDEAQTRSFFESGTWKPDAREALYRKAYSKMLARCFTPENIDIAEKNAKVQFAQFMKALGFNNTIINIEKK